MAENRIDRELKSREKTTRKKAWTRPEVLPSPNPEPGYEFRWIRVSSQGTTDATNVSSKLREGWEPAKASDWFPRAQGSLSVQLTLALALLLSW